MEFRVQDIEGSFSVSLNHLHQSIDECAIRLESTSVEQESILEDLGVCVYAY